MSSKGGVAIYIKNNVTEHCNEREDLKIFVGGAPISQNWCDKIGADWEDLIEGFTGDSRIGDSHIDVPGPDGELGFGGKCFPKDINALIELFNKNNINPLVMKAAWERNKALREI